eukprot:TRINITY_DN216_c1_g2_i2.p1 TRINITY_DN216_c1_g2~~TRINITY_DN216_c1_g2_i2.p1  ORF type:complete len:748 (+),score=64.33 TRINITY_DN216_c1_g2_i2:50-2293(+)
MGSALRAVALVCMTCLAAEGKISGGGSFPTGPTPPPPPTPGPPTPGPATPAPPTSQPPTLAPATSVPPTPVPPKGFTGLCPKTPLGGPIGAAYELGIHGDDDAPVIMFHAAVGMGQWGGIGLREVGAGEKMEGLDIVGFDTDSMGLTECEPATMPIGGPPETHPSLTGGTTLDSILHTHGSGGAGVYVSFWRKMDSARELKLTDGLRVTVATALGPGAFGSVAHQANGRSQTNVTIEVCDALRPYYGRTPSPLPEAWECGFIHHCFLYKPRTPQSHPADCVCGLCDTGYAARFGGLTCEPVGSTPTPGMPVPTAHPPPPGDWGCDYIAGCDTYAPSDCTCSQCVPGFDLSGNKTQCVSKATPTSNAPFGCRPVEHCELYIPSSTRGDAADCPCGLCLPGFRPYQRGCAARTTPAPQGAPTTGVPTTGNPTTGVPTTGMPTTGVPNITRETTGKPTTGKPTTGVPTTGIPTTGVPATGKPLTAAPLSLRSLGSDEEGGLSTVVVIIVVVALVVCALLVLLWLCRNRGETTSARKMLDEHRGVSHTPYTYDYSDADYSHFVDVGSMSAHPLGAESPASPRSATKAASSPEANAGPSSSSGDVGSMSAHPLGAESPASPRSATKAASSPEANAGPSSSSGDVTLGHDGADQTHGDLSWAHMKSFSNMSRTHRPALEEQSAAKLSSFRRVSAAATHRPALEEQSAAKLSSFRRVSAAARSPGRRRLSSAAASTLNISGYGPMAWDVAEVDV